MKLYLKNAARLHAKLGIFYVRHAKLKPVCVEKVFFSLAAYHFSKAYFLYFRKGNQIIASKVYEVLMQARLGKLDHALFERIFSHSGHRKSKRAKLIRIDWKRHSTKEEHKKRKTATA